MRNMTVFTGGITFKSFKKDPYALFYIVTTRKIACFLLIKQRVTPVLF